MAYCACKYMEVNAADTIARVQSAIDGITCRMTYVEQQLCAVQNANSEATLLQEELAMSRTERRVRRGVLVFWQMKKT